MARLRSLRSVRAPIQYRRLLVPLDASPESYEAFELACRLAADSRASITAVFVVEVPPLLPLDAHMVEAEEAAWTLLERAGATGDGYGVKVTPKLVRARDASAAIVEQAAEAHAELVVLGATRSQLGESRQLAAKSALRHVLERAPCRVMVVSSPAREAA